MKSNNNNKRSITLIKSLPIFVLFYKMKIANAHIKIDSNSLWICTNPIY